MDLITKMTFEALAQSQGKSVYEILQEVVTDMAEEYNEELKKLQEMAPAKVENDGEELL